jgi:hypothetical protein
MAITARMFYVLLKTYVLVIIRFLHHRKIVLRDIKQNLNFKQWPREILVLHGVEGILD